MAVTLIEVHALFHALWYPFTRYSFDLRIAEVDVG